jgi:hypothetical protein
VRHELLGKLWLLPEHAHNGGFGESHYCAIRHCRGRRQAQWLTIQTALAEKISLAMDGDNRFLSLIGADGDLNLAFPYVKDSPGQAVDRGFGGRGGCCGRIIPRA